MPVSRFTHLFEPLRIGNVEIKNRIALPAHGPRLGKERYPRYLEERFRGGVGLAIIGDPSMMAVSNFTVAPPASGRGPAAVVERDGVGPDPSTAQGEAFYDTTMAAMLEEEVALAHRYGVKCFAQIGHNGSYTTSPNYQPGISPSGVPDEMHGENPHMLTVAEIRRLVRAFGTAAARVQRSGFDGVEVHSAHGLLLNQFLSPLTNRRQDAYGGSVTRRLQFLREVLTEIRTQVGPDFVVGVRMPVDERLPGGLTPAEAIESVRAVSSMISYVSVSGASESGRKSGVTVPAVPAGTLYGQAVHSAGSSLLRAAIDVPVLVTGRITDPDAAEKVISEGAADIVGMVRALIADPALPTKVLTGDIAGLNRCAGDDEGCRARTLMRTRGGGMAIGCTVNPAAGREDEMAIVPASRGRRVLVVGGGPAGMEAARIAALRGHSVTLCESSQQLGGQVLVAARESRAHELAHIVGYLSEQLKRLDVTVNLGMTLAVADIDEIRADAVIVATGAVPSRTLASVDGGPQVMAAADVLLGDAVPVGKVLIVAGFDGHRAPLCLAETLAKSGHEVELITERAMVGEAQDPGTNHAMLKSLLELGVTLSPMTALKEVTAQGAVVLHSLTRAEQVRADVDSVITFARLSQDGLFRALSEREDLEIYGVGDCLAPRRVMYAMLEGARAGAAV